jgi:hypothetical protein
LEYDSGGTRKCPASGQEKQTARNRAIELVKVQWTWYGPEDATWEHEEVMWAEYPHLFENFEGHADAV